MRQSARTSTEMPSQAMGIRMKSSSMDLSWFEVNRFIPPIGVLPAIHERNRFRIGWMSILSHGQSLPLLNQ
jgi:hypothetical protein